jgi:hypothetical protein
MMLPLYHGSSGVAISCTHLCITHVFILCAGSCNGKSLGLQEANDVCVLCAAGCNGNHKKQSPSSVKW